MASNPSTSRRVGFTLIELLVVIAIIAILAAILFPVFAQAKKAAKSVASLSNAKQVGTAEKIYINDYDDSYECIISNNTMDGGCAPHLGWFSANGGWAACLAPYTKNGDIFRSVGAENPYWNAGNDNLVAGAAGSGGAHGWCGDGGIDASSPVHQYWYGLLKQAAPNGVSLMYRKAFAGGAWFNSGAITDTMAASPAKNIVHYEYASWSTDPTYHIWGAYPVAQLNNLALNCVFMDSHAKKIRGTQFRALRYAKGYNTPATAPFTANGMDLDWFYRPDGSNSSTPADDTSDID